MQSVSITTSPCCLMRQHLSQPMSRRPIFRVRTHQGSTMIVPLHSRSRKRVMWVPVYKLMLPVILFVHATGALVGWF